MPLIDFAQREITVKLVYYGPALSGKTTNLRMLHTRAAAQNRAGRLMSLDTEKDRTLFFDLLPLHFRASGVSVKFKVYTVPGQVMHNATRKIVLKGADGVAFIADSRRSETANNNEAFANLKQNLLDSGFELADMPVVIQYNKRDLPEIVDETELMRINQESRPVFPATALKDEGVLPTFFALVRMTWDAISRRHDVSGKFGLPPDEVLRHLGSLFGKVA